MFGRRRGCGCSTSAPDAAPGPYVEGAIGPEVAQQRASHANVLGTMMGAAGAGPVAGYYAGDLGSPQAIRETVDLAELIDPRAVDTSTGWPSLPGRIVAIPSWDGELGAMAPAAVEVR